MPIALAVLTNSPFGFTDLRCPMAWATSTETIDSLRRATIIPKAPAAIRSAAAAPKRVARIRSNGEGVPPSLDVSEHADAHFLAGLARNGVPDQGPNAAHSAIFLQLRRKLHAFRDHDNRKVLADLLSFRDMSADMLDGERNLRDKDDVSATR
jgi:hypothetical protein